MSSHSGRNAACCFSEGAEAAAAASGEEIAADKDGRQGWGPDCSAVPLANSLLDWEGGATENSSRLKQTVNVLPFSGAGENAVIVPPCKAMMDFEMLSKRKYNE